MNDIRANTRHYFARTDQTGAYGAIAEALEVYRQTEESAPPRIPNVGPWPMFFHFGTTFPCPIFTNDDAGSLGHRFECIKTLGNSAEDIQQYLKYLMPESPFAT